MRPLRLDRFSHVLLPLAAGAVLVATIAYHAAHRPLVGRDGSNAPVGGPASDASPPAGHDWTALPSWHLFGRTSGPDDGTGTLGSGVQGEGAATGDYENLPPASLDLQLRGIAYAADPTRAYAIIGGAEGPQKQYRAGDEVIDGVKIEAIRPLEVVVRHQGKLEALRLPDQALPRDPSLPARPLVRKPPTRVPPRALPARRIQPPRVVPPIQLPSNPDNS